MAEFLLFDQCTSRYVLYIERYGIVHFSVPIPYLARYVLYTEDLEKTYLVRYEIGTEKCTIPYLSVYKPYLDVSRRILSV